MGSVGDRATGRADPEWISAISGTTRLSGSAPEGEVGLHRPVGGSATVLVLLLEQLEPGEQRGADPGQRCV